MENANYFYKNPEEWGKYDLVCNNCEHFATFCATGEKHSVQVVATVLTGVAVAVAVAVGIGVLDSLLSENEESKGKRKKERITL